MCIEDIPDLIHLVLLLSLERASGVGMVGVEIEGVDLRKGGIGWLCGLSGCGLLSFPLVSELVINIGI